SMPVGRRLSSAFCQLNNAFIPVMFRIINGGERNYIIATVGLYVSIYNLFVSLLHLLSAFSGDD
ncbi:MAG: hypothetical protein RI567_13080, partial [Marinobacter sp.]|nr:hypothetical protein [Marinobacter sp.]